MNLNRFRICDFPPGAVVFVRVVLLAVVFVRVVLLAPLSSGLVLLAPLSSGVVLLAPLTSGVVLLAPLSSGVLHGEASTHAPLLHVVLTFTVAPAVVPVQTLSKAVLSV